MDCGETCAALNATFHAWQRDAVGKSSTRFMCKDMPNLGKEFAGFVDYVVQHYGDERGDDQVLFAAASVFTHGRLKALHRLAHCPSSFSGVGGLGALL